MPDSDKALRDVESANRRMLLAVIAGLAVTVALLIIALIGLNRVVQNQQRETQAASARNEEILNRIADYLECLGRTPPVDRSPEQAQRCLNLLRHGNRSSSASPTAGRSGALSFSPPASVGVKVSNSPALTAPGQEAGAPHQVSPQANPPAPTQEPPSPGPVDNLQSEVRQLLCPPQHALLGGCILRL